MHKLQIRTLLPDLTGEKSSQTYSFSSFPSVFALTLCFVTLWDMLTGFCVALSWGMCYLSVQC